MQMAKTSMTWVRRIAPLLLLLAVGSVVTLSKRIWMSESEFSKGETALASGDWMKLSRQIELLRRTSASSDEIRFLRGGMFLRTGKPDEAISELMRIRVDSKLHDKRQLLLCEAFYLLKRWTNVIAVGLELLREESELADAHRWLGATYFDLGDMNQAEIHLKELARLRPSDFSPHHLLGVMHKDFERFQEAILDFRRALELKPPVSVSREIRLDLALTLIKQNQFDEALATLEFDWLPNSIEPLVVRAECLWTLGRRAEAKSELSAAERISPNNPRSLWMNVRMALDEERTADALKSLEKLVAADPTNHQALYEISLAYRRLGKEADADEFLERRNAARALFERLVELNKKAINEPNNAEVRVELATVCDRLGKPELASVWRDAAAALAPEIRTQR